MQWPWHVLWWLYVVAVASNAILLLAHTGREKRSAEEMIAPRLLVVAWGGFMVWFLTAYAPPWAGQ